MSLDERWFRAVPDSSVLDRPRLLARSLIDVTELDERIAFYEWFLGVRADLRMPIPNFGGLELAAVGNLLLIASARPFTLIQRQTVYSMIVPSLLGQLALIARFGVTVLEPPESIVPGSRARVRFPDGSIAELVEHRPQPGERARPPVAAAARPHEPAVRLLARRAVPHAALDASVRFYESTLETVAEARFAPRGWPGCELVIVGNLLLVGSDALSRDNGVRIAFALLTRSPREVNARAVRGGAPGPSPDGDDGVRAVVTLASGALAELWAHDPSVRLEQ